MRHRIPLGRTAGAIAALAFLQAIAAGVGAAMAGTTGSAAVGTATGGATKLGAATTGTAMIGAATLGAATVSTASADPATPHAAATVAAATVGPIQLTIPDGFEFARSGHHDGARVSAWTKAAGSTKALLQVTLYDMGATADNSTPEELSHAAQAYLRQFLGGIERRRTDYELSPVRELSLASGPAASATWKGKLAGVDTVGVMYCAIVRKRYVVIFHTQDIGDTPTAAMREAMKSIEAAQTLSH